MLKKVLRAAAVLACSAGILSGCANSLTEAEGTSDFGARAVASGSQPNHYVEVKATSTSGWDQTNKFQFKLSNLSIKSGDAVSFQIYTPENASKLTVRGVSSESKWIKDVAVSGNKWYSVSTTATANETEIGITVYCTAKSGLTVRIGDLKVASTWIAANSLKGNVKEYFASPKSFSVSTNDSGSINPPAPTDSPIKWAGVRCSDYGAEDSVGVPQSKGEKWGEFALKVNNKFKNTTPVAIWIVSGFEDSKKTHPTAHLNFNAGSSLPSYVKNGSGDPNTSFLNYADKNGISVWLQVESGDADILKLAKIVMDKYGSHKCVKGFGVDMEYYFSHRSSKSNSDYYGQQMKDQTAKDLVKLVRNYGSNNTVFLKHWKPSIMPPSYRDGMIFVIDTQGKSSLSSYRQEVQDFAKAFKGNPVMFQIGYNDDKSIWGKLSVKEFAEELTKGLSSSSYNIGIVWVDFTLQYALDH
ncbi:MAG: hypothetical protein J5780_03580 [Treponema sp.]|nr:hypothetical protein [Treponema sp.]